MHTTSSEGTKSVNGIQLFVVSEGTGVPVVVVHGAAALGHYYTRPLMDSLAREFQVIGYDQRGCGRSSDLPMHEITADAHLADLEGLRRVLGLERLNLVAHSLGAYLALLYAARHPETTGSLVLAATAPPFIPEMMEAFGLAFRQRRTPEDVARLSQLRRSEGIKTREPSAMEEYLRILYLPFFKDRDNASRLNLSFTKASARHVVEAEDAIIPQVLEMKPGDRLREITCPTLVVHASLDAIPQAFAVLLAEQIPGAELAILDDASHFAFLEDPTKFNDAVIPFLRKYAR